MTFNTKKMIIATILVGIIFILFLGYAFNSIQKVELDIKILKDEGIDSKLNDIANSIIDKYDVAFVDDISLKDIGIDILLVNHENKSACIIKEQSPFAVDYEKLDKSIVYCNNYIVIADGVKTLIINCDQLLGNSTVRAIANAYHYEYTKTSILSPKSVVYFQTVEQDEETSFYRYAMIESAKNAYFNDEKLDSFYYYYDQWAYYEGTNQYQEVINYDYYDGLKAYVMAKVWASIDDSFNVEEYIDSYKNQYGIYSKDNEFAVMGLIWCLLMEKQGTSILNDSEMRTDIYKILLEGVPQGQVEANELRNEYNNKFVQYIMFIQETIKVCEEDMAEITPTSPILMTEKYSGTIKVAENHYIYIDYIARDNENNLLQQEYLTVHIQPYLMKLFVR